MPSTTAQLLTQQYPPIVSASHIAEIFDQHIQTIRRLARAGRLPFANVSLTPSDYRYRLGDVIEYLENPPAQQKSKRGRPVGSRNKTHAPQ